MFFSKLEGEISIFAISSKKTRSLGKNSQDYKIACRAPQERYAVNYDNTSDSSSGHFHQEILLFCSIQNNSSGPLTTVHSSSC
jgi:hypothetical protein